MRYYMWKCWWFFFFNIKWLLEPCQSSVIKDFIIFWQKSTPIHLHQGLKQKFGLNPNLQKKSQVAIVFFAQAFQLIQVFLYWYMRLLAALVIYCRITNFNPKFMTENDKYLLFPSFCGPGSLVQLGASGSQSLMRL